MNITSTSATGQPSGQPAAQPPAKKLLSWSEVRALQKAHPLQQSQIPVEHAVSLPVPTMRAGRGCYAFFAAPAARVIHQPVRQGAPDRWWLVDAHGGKILIYALCVAQPFSQDQWSTQTLPQVTRSLDELRAALASLESQMDALAPTFFAGEAGEEASKQQLAASLRDVLPEPVQPQYRALAPDFFAWLEA